MKGSYVTGQRFVYIFLFRATRLITHDKRTNTRRVPDRQTSRAFWHAATSVARALPFPPIYMLLASQQTRSIHEDKAGKDAKTIASA